MQLIGNKVVYVNCLILRKTGLRHQTSSFAKRIRILGYRKSNTAAVSNYRNDDAVEITVKHFVYT
jgi:hypothetical protein